MAATQLNRAALVVAAATAVTVVAIILWYNHREKEERRVRRNETTRAKRGAWSSSTKPPPSSPWWTPPRRGRVDGWNQQKHNRWQRLIPKLIMKKPLYDNIQMYSPDGALLCTISQKKANWYVRKQLANWRTRIESEVAGSTVAQKSQDQPSIQLLFEPKLHSAGTKIATTTSASTESNVPLSSAKPSSDHRLYNQSRKHNRCVVCGSDERYMRHYVVPASYRVLFPPSFKTHLPHDVVLLCPNCQIPAQRATQRRQRLMEQQVTIQPPSSLYSSNNNKYVIDPKLHHVRSIATALMKWKGQLPPEQIEQYETELFEWFQVSQLTDDHLQMAVQLECRTLNPSYVSSAQRVVQPLLLRSSSDKSATTSTSESYAPVSCQLPALEEFVRGWRRHFVNTMRPKYLPVGWSVDSPVRCDG